MARRGRKKKMYKKIIEHQKEDIGSGGAWNSFAYCSKEVQMKSGYTDYVRISFIVDDRNATGSTDGANLISPHLGLMWACSYSNSLVTVDGEASQLEPNDLISVSATAGAGGVVTLPVKHRTIHNVTDASERDGNVFLWVKATDITADDDIILRMFVESYGRWHELTRL